MRPWMLVGLVACTGPEPTTTPSDPAPVFVEGPDLTRPSEDVGGVRVLTATTDVPTTLTATIHDPTGERVVSSEEAATEHELVLVGFRVDAETAVTIEAVGDGGSASAEHAVAGDGLPEAMPDLDVLEHDAERLPRGWWLLPTTSPADPLRIAGTDLLLDPELQVVWWRESDRPLGDLRVTPDGTLAGQGQGSIEEIEWTGEVVRRLTWDPREPGDILLDEGMVHHEALPLDDGGFLTLVHSVVDIDPFPEVYDPPLPVPGVAPVQSTKVTHVGPDGVTVRAVELLDVIDPQRISWGSLSWSTLFQAYDHNHANAVVPDEEGGWVVSLRHQDAVIRLTPTGELDWILGDPAGWVPPYSDHLLDPVEPLVWPYHQHAPALRPGGSILMFDNTNQDHTPYTEPPGVDRPSRLVEMKVDAEAGTVEHLWSYVPERDGPLHSEAMGDADWLPGDLVMGVWGFLLEEGGVVNEVRGLGEYVARIIVIEPEADDPVVLDVRLSSDRDERLFGWGLYRAEFLETLP